MDRSAKRILFDATLLSGITANDLLLYEWILEEGIVVGSLEDIQYGSKEWPGFMGITDFNLKESINRLAAKNLIRIYDEGANEDDITIVPVPVDLYYWSAEEPMRLRRLP